MRFIHCETYQGSIVAVHAEFPQRQLHGSAELAEVATVISPVVIDQLGEVTFLSSVDTAEAAIAAAKAQIESNNRLYMDHVLEDNTSIKNAVQHFKDCGIALDTILPIAENHYYPMANLSPYSFKTFTSTRV